MDEATDEHPARCGIRVDDVDGAVAGVRHVVVEDDELVRGLRGGLEGAETTERAAVEGDHHLGLRREVLGLREQVEPGELAVVRRDEEGRRKRRNHITARGTQHVEQSEHRSERVTVGVHMARERDDTGAADHLRRSRE